MSYDEKHPVKATSALITPPKHANETPLVAAEPKSPPISPPRGEKPKPSRLENLQAPFTPITTPAEAKNELEPLPYTYNIFEGALSPDDALSDKLWQQVYSPLEATAPDEEDRNKDGADRASPGGLSIVLSTPGSSAPSKDRDGLDQKMPPLPGLKASDGAEKLPPYSPHYWPMYPPMGPPPYPPHHWQMYPPHSHYPYGYHHHYGDRDAGSRRQSHPAAYPKQQNGRYYQLSRPYGHPSIDSHPHILEEEELINDVTSNDVICGRGGAVNNHPGNRRFRKFIDEFKHQYLTETKQRKPLVAKRVLDAVKNSNPPGRILVKYPGTSKYTICPEDRAREKASQALREAAAKLRKEGHGAKSSADCASTATTESADVNQKRGHRVGHRSLPTRSMRGHDFGEELPDLPDAFDPPRKKVKQEPV